MIGVSWTGVYVINIGPLTFVQSERTTVVGVVSWGIGCGDPGYPGVYGRVTEGLDFIEEELASTC